MNIHPAIKWIIPVIFILALVAALAGLVPGSGQSFSITSYRGEAVTINARGLYYWDTVSTAAQMQANDLVTLALGLPLLAVSFWLTLRGSLRARLILTGTLGFVLYTYASMCFGAAYNQLFLVYVALFSLSLYAFILCMMSFDLKTLPSHFTGRLPRRAIAGLLFFAAAFLTLAWLGRIALTLLQNQTPALENTTTMFIQALDLGLIVPLCVIAGVLLLRCSAWGYLLTSVAVFKFISMGLAVSLMGFNMARVGIPVGIGEVAIFPGITLINLFMAYALLKSIRSQASTPD